MRLRCLIGQLVVSVMVLVLLPGCAGKTDLDSKYVGVSDYRQYSIESDNKYAGKKNMRKAGDVKNALAKDDLFELTLLDVRFASVIEGVLEEMVSQEGNELGVFITLEEIPRLKQDGEAGGEQRKLLDRRLVFSSFSKNSFEKINADNILVYRGKYNGGDLHFVVEVVEFDKESFSVAKDVAKDVYNNFAQSAMGSGAASEVVSKIIDTVGSKIYSFVTRDDLILSRSFRLVPVGHAVNTATEQFYLNEGHILVSRVSRESDYAYKDINWDKVNVLSESVEKNEYVGNESISYVLLQLYKINAGQ